MSDHLIQLAKRAHGGTRPDLETLLAETAGLLHALARARLGDTRDAEVVTADALTRVAGGFARLRDPQAYPHWVYRIVQRCVARRGGVPRAAADPAGGERADDRRGPLDTAVAVERRAVIHATVAGLPPKAREPVLLHFVNGMTYREIATMTGTGIGTVARRMQKALTLLKTRLGDER